MVYLPTFTTKISLRKTQHTPGAYPRHPQNERNSFIKCCLGVWGMFQGYVGKFLESAKCRQIHPTWMLWEIIPKPKKRFDYGKPQRNHRLPNRGLELRLEVLHGFSLKAPPKNSKTPVAKGKQHTDVYV